MTDVHPDLVYALTPGWAADANHELLKEVGRVFEWQGREWEVVSHFPMPCCGFVVALVKAVDDEMKTWQGIGCTACDSETTYTVERDE